MLLLPFHVHFVSECADHDGTCAELRIDFLVSNHGYLLSEHGDCCRPANHWLVPGVCWMDRNGHASCQKFRPRGGDFEGFAVTTEAHEVKSPLSFDVDYFRFSYRSLVSRTPVYGVLSSVHVS